MGAQPMLYRGRMPVFNYLSEDEAADVYLYLTLYPPLDSASPDATIALSQQGPAGGGGTPPPQKAQAASFAPDNKLPEAPPPNPGSDLRTVAVLSAVVAFVILLLAVGLGFTVSEFHRLSATKQVRSAAVQTKPKRRTENDTATLQRVS